MEEVLEVYHHPPDPENPVVAMDEQPVQLLKQTRPVIAAMPTCNGHAGHTERVDYEYERNGTASIFMFVAPFENWRRVSVREHRTKRDMAEELERLVMHDFASAKKVTIILDMIGSPPDFCKDEDRDAFRFEPLAPNRVTVIIPITGMIRAMFARLLNFSAISVQ